MGTTTPTVALDIVGSASTSGNLTFRGGGAQQVNLLNNSSLGFYESVGGDAGITTQVSAGTPALNIASNGHIGIGTTSSGNASLQITSPNSAYYALSLNRSDQANSLINIYDNNGVFIIDDHTASFQNLQLDQSGNETVRGTITESGAGNSSFVGNVGYRDNVPK